MEVQLIRSAVGPGDGQFLSSAIINREVAVDAGSIGFVAPLSVQRRVRHVLISHAHLDHIASLPIFLDNVYDSSPDCPEVYATTSVWKTLQQNLFNGQIWPDLVALSSVASSFLTMHEFEPGESCELAGLRVTPISLDHIVPTVGFLIEEQQTAVAIVSDTGPTNEIWKIVNQSPHVGTIFLEASFPNRMRWLAEQSLHLTPEMLAEELDKVKRDVRVVVVHLKPAFRREIEDELAALDLPNLEIGVPGTVYDC